MQKILLALAAVLVVSCSAPKEIIKSNKLSASCQCEGSGDYTIVMDAGMGNWSLFYQPLFQELKQSYKVCIIDRPGYAMDTVTTNSRDLETVAHEFNVALDKSGIKNNIVLVGHSLGGLYVRQYQALYPNKVEGIVLLDAAHSDQFNRLPEEFYLMMKEQAKQLEEIIVIARKGYLKYTKGKIPTFGLPENLLNDYYTVATSPEYYYSMKQEVEVFEENLATAKSLGNLNQLPLLVIGSKNNMDKEILPIENEKYPYENHNRIWFELQKELAKLSTNSTFVKSDNNHYLNVTDVDLISNSIHTWMENKVMPYTFLCVL